MQLCLSRKAVCVSRPIAGRVQPAPARFIVVHSAGHPSMKDVEEIGKKVEEAIKDADETCKESDAAHCAAAWDNVEELAAAASHKKVAVQNDPVSSDPLEQFCDDNPDADECRVYED